MYEQEFANRLSKLRMLKGVSAREMSLSIGQSPGYIYNIESGKAMPSMAAFFFICEYLNISPSEFFDFENIAPERSSKLIKDIKKLNEKQLSSVSLVVEELVKK